MSERQFKQVNKAVKKTDAFSIMGGAPVYTGDLVPKDALCLKLLRSPYAFARIRSIDVSAAEKLPGVVRVFTWKDIPCHRHTYAGTAYPGISPYDRYILEDTVRYVGDPVAIVAAEDPQSAQAALSKIRVEYEVLEPVLDFEKATESKSVVHPEDDFYYPVDVGGDLQHNIFCREQSGEGDFEAEYAKCEYKVDETYYTCANQQAMMETFRTFAYMDQSQRLTVVSSTQITFHARRLIAMALGIPQSRVRVIKPRIGGGFGAKQSIVSEMFPAAVTLLTGRPSYIEYTRQESCACSNTRHPFRIRVRAGADREGNIRALWVDSLENTGAYCEHAVGVIGLTGHKTIPLYAKNAAWRFTGMAVYTNTTPGGAFRGFGATQGTYAVESTMNKLADQIGIDPTLLRLRNMPEVGKPMPSYYGETLTSCALDRCIETGKKEIGWDEKYAAGPFRKEVAPGVYRGLGMAVTMQGSGITNIDNCSVRLRLDDGDFYTLAIGASDMGTGCDTILAQMAAEVLQCDPEKIVVSGVDTSYSPYDKGSYASCTTYVTGNAVVKAANELIEKMRGVAAETLQVPAEGLRFDGSCFTDGEHTMTVREIGVESVNGQNKWLTTAASFTGTSSPPPFVAAFAEVEVDTNDGTVKVCDLVGVVDCGTVINKALAKVQTEGGFAQGVGMALYEDARNISTGRLETDTFMQYKIPARTDLPPIRIFFEESYEPTGPFGAKSIGEVVINTPTPAIVSAIRNAVGVEIHDLPATAEKVYMALHQH